MQKRKEKSIFLRTPFSFFLKKSQLNFDLFYFFSDHKNKRMFFDHRDINEELDFVSKSWKLDENSTMLHSLSLYHTYGVVAALMSPLSVGGSVVMLPQFDTKKVL